MTSLTEFFSRQEDDNLKGISHKNNLFKRNIIAHMAVNGECTLSELTKELHISIPTITKLVQELVQENIVTDLGKVETPGGRRPTSSDWPARPSISQASISAGTTCRSSSRTCTTISSKRNS